MVAGNRATPFVRATEQVRCARPPQNGEEWFDLIVKSRPLQLIQKDGRAISVEATGSPVSFDNHRSYEFFFREITDQARGNKHYLRGFEDALKGMASFVEAHRDQWDTTD